MPSRLKKFTVNWQGENQHFVNQLDDFKGVNSKCVFQNSYRDKLACYVPQWINSGQPISNGLKQQIANTLVSLLYVGAFWWVFTLWHSICHGRASNGGGVDCCYMAADPVISPIMTCIQLYNNMSPTQPPRQDSATSSSRKSHLELVRGEKQALIRCRMGPRLRLRNPPVEREKVSCRLHRVELMMGEIPRWRQSGGSESRCITIPDEE